MYPRSGVDVRSRIALGVIAAEVPRFSFIFSYYAILPLRREWQRLSQATRRPK